MVVIVPVISENGDSEPPDVPCLTFGRLSDMVLPFSNHVAERVDKLDAVPADTHRHYPQPGEAIESSHVKRT
jgi:hypothetical protein